MSVVTDLLTAATRKHYIGKTVGQRVTSIVEGQREALRLTLLRGIKRGDSPDAIAKAVQKFYAGSTGNGGPSYEARRLVQSEITRFNALVADEVGQQIAAQYEKIPIYTYHTQQDDVVRPEHAAAEGNEYTTDDLAGGTSYDPVSEAHDLLSDPNCRCWLDVSYEDA